MARIPITIEKIRIENAHRQLANERLTNETVKYLFKLEEKGMNWEKTLTCTREELIKFRDLINKLIDSTTTAEILKLTPEDAATVDEHYKTDTLCQGCTYKLTSRCVDCLFVMQSPLERRLFLELNKAYIRFEAQYALNWYGKKISTQGRTFHDATHNFKEVLTVVDFYIETPKVRLCVYTDGHTYHERTEEQATHDRNIDRKLQELGYHVLRYTGKEVLADAAKIIDDIQKWTA